MTAHVASQPSPEPASAAITPLLRTVLLCDLVESTALVERLGDSRVAQLLQRHDQRLVRRLAEHNGQLIDKSDGVLALFERPIQALAFAMDYQRDLRELGQSAGEALQARIGIHVGDVMTWTHTPAEVLAGAKPVEVEGLAKPVAARLMGLALPGQILLSGMAQNFAQRAQAELGERAGRLHWRFHGRYRFKGVPAPMLVHEAGETGLAPLKPPPSGAKAWREVPFWRKPPVLAIEALLLIGVASFGIYSAVRSPPAIAFAERDWVVVADFNNRTDETLYDDALDSALRVGLEQSRYVNVLSDLQVEQALQRMQRTAQTLDRQTGSELALREGAKALVLPTIAEVGGRPRVSVEVVDPNSGVTVYTRMADASGSGGVVAALDDVITEMRADLGESLTSIQKNNVPLEKATTENLEALRAYSLGVQAKNKGDAIKALQLFDQAIKLDSMFSLAYLRIGFIKYSNNDNKAAQKYLKMAAEHRSRLTNRENLMLDAGLAIYTTTEQLLEKWKLLASIYPDEYRAYYNYAFFAETDAMEYGEALKFLEPALDIRNPARASAYYLRGVINLQLNRYHDAESDFAQARALGVGGVIRNEGDNFAAQRDYGSAFRVITSQAAEFPGAVVEERLGEISYYLDQGDWPQVWRAVNSISATLEGVPPATEKSFQLVRLSLQSYESTVPGEFKKSIDAFITDERARLKNSDELDKRNVAFNILAAGWIAARHGYNEIAGQALSSIEQTGAGAHYIANIGMQQALKAEISISENKSAEAIKYLESLVKEERGLYSIRAVLMRAYIANGQCDQAIDQADWLLLNRGRAYAEYNSMNAWQAVNLIESNLAMLTLEHCYAVLGQEEKAAASAAAFDKIWSNARKLPVTRGRLQEFKSRL